MKRTVCLLAVGALLGCGRAAEVPRSPNVVVILADDLGYGDVRCYNPARGKIPTPNIDRLAAQGMRFTDGHSSSGVCSPSRYTLLTGRYHWRTRLQSVIVGVFGAPLIAPERLTIGSLAKQRGYRTACIGKWHLGWDWPIPQGQRALFQVPKGKSDEAQPSEVQLAAWREVFGQPIPGGPTSRGFDAYFGTDVPNWPPYCFMENDRTVGLPSELLPMRLLRGPVKMASLPGPALKDWQMEAILPALGERACATLREWSGAKGPFLLYMPLTAPHEPLAVNAPWKGKSGLNVYADFVMEVDAAVGRVLDTLEGCGQLVHQADLLATLADIFGVKLPDGAGEDSFSILPLLLGSDSAVRPNAVSCGASGVPGLRKGAWKFVSNPEAELYNLEADIGETKNLAAEQPERVAAMQALLDEVIAKGRSTPGAPQKNDVEVQRHPQKAQGAATDKGDKR